MKNLASYPHHRWSRILRAITLAVSVAGGGFLVPVDGGAQGLPAHEANMTSQHNALSNAISGQGTAHDSAQTSQHDALSQQISNLSTSGDHSGLPQAWDKTIQANDSTTPGGCNSSRFTCVMGGTAVRDNETGLVWEQSPATTPANSTDARFTCANKNVGGRKGWRLPSFAELASLVDPTQANPALPLGHPFTNVQIELNPDSIYWSATTNRHSTVTQHWFVSFRNGNLDIFDFTGPSVLEFETLVWCVRGAMNADQY